MWLIILVLMCLPRLAYATGATTLAITAGSGETLCTSTRPQTAGGSDVCKDEVMAVMPWTAASRTQSKITASGTSQALFGGATTCAYVLLVTDVGNAGPVHWNYGTATTNSVPLPAGTILKVNAPANLDGNGIEVIQGSGCSSNCLVWGVCQ